MNITLKQMRYFIAAAENGKVTTAGVSIGISPSAITNAIQELEAMLGVTLFDRHHKGLQLTYNGHHFFQQAQNVLSAVSTAMHTFKDNNIYSGKLKLAVSATVAGYFLTPLLTRFKRAFANIEVEIVELSRIVAEKKVQQGDVDIALLLVSNTAIDADVTTEILVSSKRKLWVSPDHLLLQKKEISLLDVAQFPYIQLTIDEATKSHLSYWNAFGHQPNIIFKTSAVEAVRSLVATGEGVTILSDMVYRPWSLEGERIESRSIIDNVPSMDIGLLWTNNRDLTEIAQVFIEFCRMEYKSGQRR